MAIGQAYRKWLTKREEEALAIGCDVLIDHLFEDLPVICRRNLQEVAATTLGGHLPRRYLPKYTPVILKQFAVCILTVAWKLAQPKHIPLACIAEELAAWAILSEAKAVIGHERGEAAAEQAFERFREYYFEDEDFMYLFDDFYDGVDQGHIGETLQMTSLALADWFVPFGDDDGSERIVHPYVSGDRTVGVSPSVGQAYSPWLTQREQEALASGCVVLIDLLFEDITKVLSEEENATLLTLWEILPDRYLPTYTPIFYKQFAVCVTTVAWKLAQPEHCALSSVAEELAAYALLRQAKEVIELDHDVHGAEEAFARFFDRYFEDTDFLFLFDASSDGIDASPVGQFSGMTSLSLADWFRPFSDEPSRMAHPYAFGD